MGTADKEPRTLITAYATAMMAGLQAKIEGSGLLDHRLTKGELRELFLVDVLRPFLSVQFGVGSGIVVNPKGEQSSQTDIVIYDKRILPPFIESSHIGVFPAESVVGTIEVKSRLTKGDIKEAEKSASHLRTAVFTPGASPYKDLHLFPPLTAILGFYGNGARELKKQGSGKVWLDANAPSLIFLCLFGRFSWLRLSSKGWWRSQKNERFEETKRFIAVFVDNIRTLAEQRLNYFYFGKPKKHKHKDWIGLYIRE